MDSNLLTHRTDAAKEVCRRPLPIQDCYPGYAHLPMASYFRATLRDFLNTSDSEVLAKLTLAYANSGFSRMHSDQPLTWWDDLVELRQALHTVTTANPSSNCLQILLEFSIPRKERRLYVVLLTGAEIILLECKRGP